MRQIEIGLASLLSLLFELTILVFGLSMLLSRRFPRWLGWLGLVGGLGTVAAGIAQAYTGFSALAMMLSMPASSVLLVWAIAVSLRLMLVRRWVRVQPRPAGADPAGAPSSINAFERERSKRSKSSLGLPTAAGSMDKQL